MSGSLWARVFLHTRASGRVYTKAAKIPEAPVALVLGARVYPNGRLSPLLRDRVNKAIDLYRAGRVKKLLMSGDNRFAHYNEPERMKEYAIAHGVPACDIAADYAGRRTYDSIYRAKYIFGQNELIVVSQSFHLDRAIFYCDRIGVKATGFAADRYPVYLRTLIREYPGCLCAIADGYVRKPHPVLGRREHI